MQTRGESVNIEGTRRIWRAGGEEGLCCNDANRGSRRSEARSKAVRSRSLEQRPVVLVLICREGEGGTMRWQAAYGNERLEERRLGQSL